VNEVKKACDCQIKIKQKIISGQNEINKLSDIIEINKNISSTNNNLSNLISFTGTKNSKDNSPSSNNENNNQDSNNDNLKEKINELKNLLSVNQNRYQEFTKIIDKIYAQSLKNDYSDLQKDFVSAIIKNSNYKIQLLDIQYKNMLVKAKNDIKNEYIKELEKQIKFRDDILKENNLDLSAKMSINKLIKELDFLKNDYKKKLSKNFNSNYDIFNSQEKYQSIYCTNPNRKNSNNIKTCPRSNISQLNRINIKYKTNINNLNSNIYNAHNIVNQKRPSQSKLIVIKSKISN
jgi:hypothetical protein